MSVQCTESEREEIKQNIQQLILLTKLYKLNTEDLNIDPTITHWCSLISRMPIESIKDHDGTEYRKSRTITLTKYKTAAYVAAWTGTSIPIAPFGNETGCTNHDLPHILIGGRFYIFTHRLILSRPAGDYLRLSFLQTIIQSKALMVRPDKEFVRYAEIKTFEKLTGSKVFNPESNRSHITAHGNDPLLQKDTLTTVLGTNPDNQGQSMHNTGRSEVDVQALLAIKARLRKTVESIFKTKYTDQHRLAYTLPSASSNYNFTRKMFGALGHLLPHAQRLGLNNGPLIYFNRVEVAGEQIENESEKYEVDVTRLTKAVYEFRKSVFEEALNTTPYASPLGLSEPNKVRVITKGPPSIYFILKPLQKFMHNTMRKIPQFRLMGEEINTQMLGQMFPHHEMGSQKLLSGDYSDATNELKMWVSNEITTQVIETLGLTAKEAILVRRSLTEHVMRLEHIEPKTSKPKFTEAKQTEGQLMGSILSFIWLCISNFSLIWLTKEKELDEDIEFEDLKVLINGDDCLFTCKENGKTAWEYYGNVMGLRPSIGKVFFTNEFCTLNSRMFTMGPLNTWGEIQYIASSLLSGKEKSVRLGTEKFIDPLSKLNDIGQRNYWLMHACPTHMRYEVQSMFIKNNEALLKNQLLYGIDWFMPFWSGGLGMCDVMENGWIINYTNIKGNPTAEFDDNMEPTGMYKEYLELRDNDPHRKKSRCALYNMLVNWGKTKFRPVAWKQPLSPDGLDMLSVIGQRMPIKPTEMLVGPSHEEPKDNINEQLFGLMALDVYLTDKRTQDLIQQNLETAVNLDPTSQFYVEGNKVLKLGRDKNDWEDYGEINSTNFKQRHNELKEMINDTMKNEHIKRIKYNRAIWQNNIRVGCKRPASYEKISTRKYIKLFQGKIIGKGTKVLNDLVQEPMFDYIWDEQGAYSRIATKPVEW